MVINVQYEDGKWEIAGENALASMTINLNVDKPEDIQKRFGVPASWLYQVLAEGGQAPQIVAEAKEEAKAEAKPKHKKHKSKE